MVDIAIVFNTLGQVLSPNDALRRQAENALEQLSHQPGFALSLATITTSENDSIPLHMRQLAGILLKKHVKKYWNTVNDPSKIVISPQEKQVLKENLPKTLGSKSSKISTTVAMIIAEIASFDFPEQWSDLLSVLIQQFENAKTNKHLAYGSLKCLSLVAEHFGDRQVEVLFPNLFPYVMNIANNQYFSANIRAKALIIASELINLLGMLKMEFEEGSITMIKSTIPETLRIVLPIISQPSKSVDEDCSLKMASVKVIMSIIKYFSKELTGEYFNQILQSFMSSLISEYSTFIKTMVMSDYEGEKRYDSSGDRVDFDTLIVELLELLCTFIGKEVFKRFMFDQNNAVNLLSLLLGYVQITIEQQDIFEEDPNQFVFDESVFSIRASALSAICELKRSHKEQVSISLVQSIQKYMQESARLYQEKNPLWWKPREACLTVMEYMSNFFAKIQDFDILGLMNAIIHNDLSDNAPVYLKSRAIQLTSKFFSVQPLEMHKELLRIYIKHTTSIYPLPIRLYATLAIARFISSELPNDEQKRAIIQPYISEIVLGSCNLMREASDDNIHMPLEALASIIRFIPESISHIGKDIISLLLELCAKFASDPTVPMDITNVFEQMAKSRQNYEILRDMLVPKIAQILISTVVTLQQAFVEILINILTTIVVYSSPQDIPFLLSTCFLPIVNLVLNNDDPNLLSNGTECLRAYIHLSGDYLLNYEFTVTENNEIRKRPPLQYILQVIAKFLGPDLLDHCVSDVGDLVSAVFTKVGNQLPSDITATIIKAAINRLSIAKELRITESLIIMFAKLIHSHMEALISLLSSYNLKNVKGENLNALLLLLQKWADNQSHFFGGYKLKVSILAIVKLLMSGDQRLMLTIQIDAPDLETKRYNTRSRGPLKKQSVLFPLQAFVLIIEGYFTAKEAREMEEKGDLENLLYGASDDEEYLEEDSDEGHDDTLGFAEASDHELKHLISSEYWNDQEEDDIEDKFDKQDPIYKVDLEKVLPGYIEEILRKHSQLVHAAQPLLTDKQKKFINNLMTTK